MARHPRPGDWLTSQEASNYLGITLRTLYRLIDQEGLPAYQVGRLIRLRRPEVEAWLEQARVQPGALGHLLPPYEET